MTGRVKEQPDLVAGRKQRAPDRERVALWLARERGLSVIPLSARGKRPMEPWARWQRERADEQQIHTWFAGGARQPNVGIVTGRVSNIVVVDVDSAAGLTWAQAHLPPSPMRTATAKGEHWYFRHPGAAITIPNTVRIPTADPQVSLDLRADGGYVVGPGSVHPSGALYTRLGDWPPVDELPLFQRAWIGGERPTHAGDAGAPITEGRRNDTLWRLARSLHARGLSPTALLAALHAENLARCRPPLDDADVVTMAARAATHPDRDQQNTPGEWVRDEAAQTDPIGRHGEHSATAVPQCVRVADVQPEAVSWCWPGRVAAGKLAILVGDPGLGKSWITLDIAARVSAGRSWPDGAPADVLLLSAEDGLADTIRPRLDALGADVTRVYHLAVLKAGDHERAIQLADVAALEAAIRLTAARVLIIDPVSAYLGATDSHRDAEVRGLLAPLAALAERTSVAILGVMHLAKSGQRPAIYRAIGSIAFAAAARIALAVARDPEREDRRLLVPVKSNLSAPPAALAYALTDGRLTWEPEPVADVDVDALLNGPPLDREERREADAWLRGMLTDGPVASKSLETSAREAGLAWRTVRRAKDRIGAEAELLGYGRQGKWYWRLPAETARDSQEMAATGEVAISEQTAEKARDLARDSPEMATSNQVAISGNQVAISGRPLDGDPPTRSDGIADELPGDEVPPFGISQAAWAATHPKRRPS